ncbi:hypothetical protein HAN_1g94 (nucleomorph) [Hemiselmis andersenii]|uniref:PIN domain-containing protein n=1 Tax=Hemiselmis andersenii TaxID=464988 RepID=A9BKA4_HEMAN|nr:hypothetical protein HAN_1g94 [Hemiselmis andersenii]ABW97937.1 hypothetical protein HAN_1g94 [Hemiselmis andersenii]|mmetsp:Transcript_37049/g.86829  ORF Transcript_37049/g.86829 Transcript_37049/m.86829 type:complete len:144 (+) Transcript_37049:85-516(+)
MNKNSIRIKLLKHKKSLNPPFFVLVDTNFIYFTLKNKIDLFSGFSECFLGKVIVCVSNCVLLELEKLGPKFRLALNCMRDIRIQKINCTHPSNVVYADDCICETLKTFQTLFVATCDKSLKQRIKEISSRPVISIKKKKFILS